MSTTPVPTQRTDVTGLELHPDGARLRLTRHTYLGSALYGPALAGLFPEATPVRRLDYEVLPDGDGLRQRRAVWLLEGGGDGEGWQRPDDLPAEVHAWAHEALAPEPPRRPHWQRRGGWAALLAWLDTELAAQGFTRQGVPQVKKDWGISFLAQVETDRGRVYLKAVPDFFLAEVRVTCALQHTLSGAAAPLLAADTVRGLMLLQDAGEPLDNGASGWFELTADPPVWTLDDSRAVMHHLARVQRGSEGLALLDTLPDHGPEWVRAQLPDLLAEPHLHTGTPEGLTPEETQALLALRPQLEAALDRLAASPLPRTLGHGDLHEGNVLRQDEQFTLLDWSDASVTHPFLDGGPQYMIPKDHRPAGVDAYLEAWTDLLPLPDLRALLRDGLLAGELYRALGYTAGIQPHVADDDWTTAHLAHFRALLQLGAPEVTAPRS